MSGASFDSHMDVHTDKKTCLRSTTLVDLPVEILVRIFAHLDAIQVARIQRVSRQWHRIIRSTPVVWRDASLLDYDLDEPLLPTLLLRLYKLSSLSDRKLDKVGIWLEESGSCCLRCPPSGCRHAEDMTNWLFATLCAISVRELCVFLEEFGGDRDRHEYRDTVTRNLEQLSHADYESFVIRCLRSDDNSHLDREDGEGLPELCDAVGLSDDVKYRLYLDTVTFSSRVKPSSKLFASLTGLHLDNVCCKDHEDARSLWTLLEAMQDTLHELFLSLTSSGLPFAAVLGDEDETVTTLAFTKLIRLHLGYLGKESFEHLGPQLYKFSCPVLESLSLNYPALHVLFDDLLTSTVNCVRVTCRTLAYEGNVKALTKSKGLHKLFIDPRTSFDGDDQRRVLHTALKIAPPELILVFDHLTTKADIMSFTKLVEDIYPFVPNAPKVGFCNVIRDHASRRAHFDDLRTTVPNADRYVWMDSDRPHFAMHERAWEWEDDSD